MTIHTGSCHCGRVRFEVDADIDHVRVCDCSICRKRGALNFRVPKESLRLLTPWEDLLLYQWGSRTAKDYFCPTCGILSFRRPSDPTERDLRRGVAPFDGWAINVRCLDGVDIDSLPIKRIPGSKIRLEARSAVSTERVFSASPREVFAAFEQAEKLAQWWGPKDFTNTFERFEFEPGGRWVFAMHGPNGASHPNESVFREIQRDAKVVIEHVVKPRFVLTVTLTPRGDQTHLAWVQEFENPEVTAKMRPLSEPANEQNLDRLQALLASQN